MTQNGVQQSTEKYEGVRGSTMEKEKENGERPNDL
jgi:hypothetical protein